MRHLLALTLCLAPLGALAEGCPPPPDHSDALSALIAEAQGAETDMEGRAIGNRMWELWADAPDEVAQTLLDEGMQARSSYDFLRAIKAFDRLVAYCPDYAEGYNQRAFVNFLRQDYAAALVDLEATLDRSPRHIAALAGKGLTLVALGRNAEALIALGRAVELNPWLSERHLLEQLQTGQEL